MNPRKHGRWGVAFTHPVTGEDFRVPLTSQLGRAAMANNVDEVVRLHHKVQRDLDRQIRVAELRGRSGRAHAWTTLYNHAIKQGKTFTIHLIPMVQP